MKFRRALECAFLFVAIPLIYTLGFPGAPVIPILLVIMLVCLWILLRDPSFDRKQLWNPRAARANLPRILGSFIVGAAVLSLAVLLFDRNEIFSFIRMRPVIWVLIMVLYPLLSVYPQELIYRAYFFHRYRSLFNSRLGIVAVSAVAFGFMHIIFQNVLAVILTLAGGFLFARTFDRTKSLFASSIEHALYGDFIFTIGLGIRFYHGAIR